MEQEPELLQATDARGPSFTNLGVKENPIPVPPNTSPSRVTPVDDGSFAELDRVLQKWFYKSDLQAIRIVMGTLKAHYLKVGDPAWLFVVAPPGSGKTTVSIMGAAGLDSIAVLSDVTENTFLSGFYGHKDPGLLEKLGPTESAGNIHTTTGDGVFLVKDFTTVLTMRRDKRGAILSQLREIHDGQFRKDFGTGVTKIWKGRISIVAAVTPVLDQYYAIFNVLGERFLQVRWHRPDSAEAGEWAIAQQGHEEEIRLACQNAIQPIFTDSLSIPPILSKDMTSRLAKLAEIVAVGRTKVMRGNFGGREIEFVPEPEANTRIAKGLAAIARGVAAMNKHSPVEEQDLQDAFRVGMETLPELRRQLIVAALHGEDVSAMRGPRTTRQREVEELQALGVFREREATLADQWRDLFVKADVHL